MDCGDIRITSELEVVDCTEQCLNGPGKKTFFKINYNKTTFFVGGGIKTSLMEHCDLVDCPNIYG